MSQTPSYPQHPLLESVLSILTQERQSSEEDLHEAPGEGRSDQLEDFLSQAMDQMSLEDRNRALNEAQGILDIPDETDQSFVSDKLESMKMAISRISVKDAYDVAVRRSPDYAGNASLCLQFLRAEKFDPRLAAHRMVRYFEMILEHFGDAALGRPLTLHDLNSDDKEVLSAGRMQILSRRDRVGRMILCDLMSHNSKKLSNSIKCWIYLFAKLASDLESSRKGVVLLVYSMDNEPCEKGPRSMDVDLYLRRLRSFRSLPIRITARHLCASSHLVKQLFSTVLKFVTPAVRMDLRAKIHDGSTAVEWRHSLLSAGIPVDAIPLTESGRIKKKDHLKWMERQRWREIALARTGFFDGIELPLPRDVLGGKGKPNQDYIGNQYMKEFVEARFDEYDGCQDTEKKHITEQVVEEVLLSGGRFLAPREADGGLFWEEISKGKARERVGVCFRSVRAKKRRRTQGHQTVSGTSGLSVSRAEDGCCGGLG